MDADSLHLGTRNLWAWLVRLLSKHQEWLNTKMKFFLPTMDLGFSNEVPDPEQRVIQQLSKLHAQGLATWQSFIYGLCMELEVPLDLEVPLLSIWGQEDEFSTQLEAGEESQPGSQFHPGLKRSHQSCGSSPCRKHCRKQQLELARKYLQLLKTFAQQRYGGKCLGPEHTLTSQQAFIPPILQWSKATAPLDAREGASMGDPGAADDIDMSIQDLFNFKAHKGPRVTVLLGKAGMGKTMLAYQLCRKWADGQLDNFQALFLYEFRQLNMITHLLTLPQLLFDLYLSPESGPDAVFQYLEENACQVLLIFDGLDEASVGADSVGSALTLFSDLCRGTLLPGCWVMATSRPGKLPTCVPTEAAMVYMWGFDGLRVEKYVSHFFSDLPSQKLALAEMRTNERLWGMCAVPALCRVACLCLHHLLPGSSPGQSAALLATMTQLYLQMVLTFGSHRTATSLLDLGKVALRGLDTGKVIFSAEDIPPPLMAFGAAHSLLTSFCICTTPEHQETGYAFAHLSLQEFLAALYLMASDSVDKDTLIHYVALNSHWVLRTKARLGLSDHLSTFLAGLASHNCCQFLSHLAQRNEAWVSSRQAAVVQVLRKLATRKHTGPKVVELCHCVAETQEPELARLIAQNLPFQFSFHNFPLTRADLASLASILEQRASPIHLDFDGCPLEPYCPEVLVGCGQVENLSFKSRKCGDTFVEALCRSLPTMGSLQTLGLTGSKITARGISYLVQALPLCSKLEEISLQDNQLKDPEVLSLAELLPCLPQLRKLDLSRNSFSVSTLLSLVKVATTCPTVRKLQVRESDLLFLLSPLTETIEPGPSVFYPYSRLQKCQLRVHDAEALVELFQKGPQLEEVDLSGNYLEDEGCRLMAEAASQLHIARKLDLSDNGLSGTGMAYVLRAMGSCGMLAELYISLLSNTVVLTFAYESREQEGSWKSIHLLGGPWRTVDLAPCRLTSCDLQAKHTEKLCEALRASCYLNHLGHLDLSDNALGDEGVALLAQQLPSLGPLQSLNLSKNGLSLNAVFGLVQCMSSLSWMFHLDVSLESEHILLRGAWTGSGLAHGSGPHFLLQECQLEPLSLTHLCDTLKACPGPLEIQLSCKTLSDDSLETLLRCLPQLPQLSLLQLRHTVLSSRSPLLLANFFNLCPRVQKVDLRSLYHVALYFQSSEKQEGVCFGFHSCNLSQEHVEPLCCALGRCKALSQLDLTGNLLGDGGLRCLLEHLPQLPISGWLDLSHNSISQEGILHLLETLPSYPHVSVSFPSLMQCHRGGEGQVLTRCQLDLPQLTGLLNLVRRPAGLLGLRLEEPWVGQVGLPALLEVCVQTSGCITELSISETQQQLWIRVEFPRQEESPEATALRLAHCDLATNHELLMRQLMETCARLQQLSLSQVNLIDDDGARSWLLENLLLSPCELKSFRLTSSCVSTQNLAHLASGLGYCRHLEELDFSNNQLCEEGVELLMRALQGTCMLKRLHLSHFPLGESTLTLLIGGLSHMTDVFFLRHNQIGDTGAQHLAAILPRLSELRKETSSNLSIQEGRVGMSLGPLNVYWGRVWRRGSDGCPSHSLSGNSIGPAGGAQLAKSLTLCKCLEEIMLGHNALGDLTVLGLAQGLPPQLRVLCLPASCLGPEGALCLAQALEQCPQVEEVSLAENNLSGGVPRFGKGLPLLRQIDLISCEIDDQAAKHLAASLILCPALEEILLSWNLLGDEAAAELARILPHLGQLKRVDLEKNRITTFGAQLLAQGLTQGLCVPVIRLWNNPIPADVAQSLQSQEPRLDFAFFDKQ
uniref:Protein NLRC5 n=1 Tax=Nannospalax galili TaxID=1026970 RepID=A0A8C6RVZ4_NANGA